MGLRKDRKGTIAMMDALIFIFLISLMGTWIFTIGNIAETGEPMAKTVSDDFFSVDVGTKDLMYLGDTKVLPVETLIAASMNEGMTGKVSAFVSGTMDDLIPEAYGYEFVLKYNGHTMRFQRTSDRELTSEYTEVHQIEGAGELISTLKIY